MEILLSQIASKAGVDFSSDDIKIDGIHTLVDATSTQLSFFTDSKYIEDLKNTKAAAVFVDEKHAEFLPSDSIALITDEAYLKLAIASEFFAHKMSAKSYEPKVGNNCDISSSAIFGSNVTIEDNVTILPGCYVGDNVTIGSNTLLHANVTIYHNCVVGSECIIHSGTVVGCDGYGFAHTKLGEHIKIYQNGNVVIEDSVEIGSSCTLDRSVFGSTVVGKGTKLDNQIHIGHNCELGENVLMAAQSGLAGTTKLGKNVVMGGQSGATGHMSIGDFTTIYAKSVITKSVDGGHYAGFPAVDLKLWRKMQAKLSSLTKRKK